MGQQFKKIRAASLDEAYRAMRRQYGLDAVVVSTKQLNEGGLFGFFGQRMVEITASVPAAETQTAARKPSAIERKYAAQQLSEQAKRDVTIERYEHLIRDAQRRMNGEAPAMEMRASATEPSPQEPVPAPRPVPEPVSISPVPLHPHTQTSEAPMLQFPRSQSEDIGADALRREVHEIREMLQVLYSESPGAGLPAEFAPHYRSLVARGVSRKVAAQLVAGVVRDSDLSALRNSRIFEERLKLEIRKLVPVTGGLAIEAGTCRIVTLCGPTGVGKTTNLAKLAAQFTVRERARVAMITADTYRIAAPEQLRVYANIIGVPLRVVNDLKEIKEALRDLQHYDLVFMDTAGNSQFNLEQINELKSLLQAVDPFETILALSANTHLEDLRSIVSNFKCLNPASILFTKIDETRQYGAMLTIMAEAGLPLAYLSNGQNVPDDIRVASSAIVANLIMEGKENRG